jgi:hypothetical protein
MNPFTFIVSWRLAPMAGVIDPVTGTIRLKPKGPEPGRERP